MAITRREAPKVLATLLIAFGAAPVTIGKEELDAEGIMPPGPPVGITLVGVALACIMPPPPPVGIVPVDLVMPELFPGQLGVPTIGPTWRMAGPARILPETFLLPLVRTT